MLIGISAKKQCGKDTVCTIIEAIDVYYNTRFIPSTGLHEFVNQCLFEGRLDSLSIIRDIVTTWNRESFAKRLRSCLYTITGDSRIFALDDETKNSLSTIKDAEGNYYTIRQLLQKFGTEVGRSISPNLWVDALMNDYIKAKSDGYEEDWIVTDVRFRNEAEAIRENGGILIRLNRNTGFNDQHSSETALDDYENFDLIIDNNGTLDELIDKVYNFMKEFKFI